MELAPAVVVADAGPLLHLHWIGASGWSFPPTPISVVRRVADEVTRLAPDALVAPSIVIVPDPPAISSELSSWRLDAGEAAALTYAPARTADAQVVLLCDDRQARAAGQALGLTVTGSVGLILQAARAGRVSIDVARTALQRLPGPGRLHISVAVLEEALKALNE